MIMENKKEYQGVHNIALEDLKQVSGGTGGGSEETGFKKYVVQPGDSLHSIAEAHGITTTQLALLNKDTIIKTAQAHGYYFDDPVQYAYYIFEGEELLVP